MNKQRRKTGVLAACVAAAVYGCILVYSSAGMSAFVTQVLSLLLGTAAAWLISAVESRRLAAWSWLPGVISLVLMGLTFTSLGYTVPGTDDRNWLYLSLGGRTLLFQPSELLKIVFILTFSAHLVAVRERLHRVPVLMGLCAHGLIPVLLVFFQGDDGNAAVLLLLFVAMLFAGGVPLRFLLAGTGVCAAAVPLLWRVMSEDKKARFLCLIHVEDYLDTAGWQQQLSLIALGSGQCSGLGYGEGGDHGLYARHNDFILTVAGEELGFFGAVLLLALLLLVLVLLYRRARVAEDPLNRLLCMGLFSLIAIQSTINIGMTLRLFPVLGITLPFFSAGGSSLLTLFLGVGLAMGNTPRTLSVSQHIV